MAKAKRYNFFTAQHFLSNFQERDCDYLILARSWRELPGQLDQDILQHFESEANQGRLLEATRADIGGVRSSNKTIRQSLHNMIITLLCEEDFVLELERDAEISLNLDPNQGVLEDVLNYFALLKYLEFVGKDTGGVIETAPKVDNMIRLLGAAVYHDISREFEIDPVQGQSEVITPEEFKKSLCDVFEISDDVARVFLSPEHLSKQDPATLFQAGARLTDTFQTEQLYMYFYRCALLIQENRKQTERSEYQRALGKQDKLKTVIKDLRAKEKQLNKEIKALKEKAKNDTVDPQILITLHEKIDKKDAEIQKLNKEIRENASGKVYENLANKLQEDNLVLKNDNKALRKDVKDLRKMLASPSKLLTYLKEQGLFEEVAQILRPEIEKDIFESQKIEKEKPPAQIEQQVAPPKPKQHLGYLEKKDGQYFINTGLSGSKEINIPQHFYVALGQFLIVDSQGDVKKAFMNVYKPIARECQISRFGIAVSSTEMNLPGSMAPVRYKNALASGPLKGNILALDSNNNLLGYFRVKKMTLDDFQMRADEMNHRFAIVENVLENGYVIRDLRNNQSIFKEFTNEKDLTIGQAISYKDDKIISAFTRNEIYTRSSYYNEFIKGFVENTEHGSFLRTSAGTLLEIFSHSNKPLKDGAYCEIDGEGNLLRYNTRMQSGSDQNKVVVAQQRKRSNFTRNTEAANASVLIVGNIKYKRSYQDSLRNKGYEANVVDGFSPWKDVSERATAADYVVVVTQFISHDNMHKLKKELPSQRILYSSRGGASAIADQLNNAVATH